MDTESLSHIDLRYESTAGMKFNVAEEAVRLSLMQNQGDDEDVRSSYSNESHEEPAQKRAWEFFHLQYVARRGTPTL